MCNRHFGSVVAQTIRTQKTDQFPLFLIIMGKRSSNEVLNVIQGKVHVTRGVQCLVYIITLQYLLSELTAIFYIGEYFCTLKYRTS